MRITLTRCGALCVITLLIVLFWYLLFSNHTTHDRRIVKTCQHSDAFIKHLHDITERVHQVLKTLGLTHWLCYNSLWGQIRLSRSLPWEERTQFCLLNEELMSMDELFIRRAFDKQKLQIQYNSAEGIYYVTDEANIQSSVELFVFEEDKMIHMYRRIGWKHRVLPPDCESMKSLECFPPRLIAAPLPLKEFGGYTIPVPREGIELQKYHYEENWWKDIKPDNC